MENKYDGWLISNSFVKRALAVLGYSVVGTLIIYIPLAICAFALGFIGSS